MHLVDLLSIILPETDSTESIMHFMIYYWAVIKHLQVKVKPGQSKTRKTGFAGTHKPFWGLKNCRVIPAVVSCIGCIVCAGTDGNRNSCGADVGRSEDDKLCHFINTSFSFHRWPAYEHLPSDWNVFSCQLNSRDQTF